MSETLDIAVTRDRTTAYVTLHVTLHSPQTAPEEIRAAIARAGIVEGLLSENVSEAHLREAFEKQKDGEAETVNLIVAEVKKPTASLLLGEREMVPAAETIWQLKTDMELLHRCLTSGGSFPELPECLFVNKGRVFCRERLSGTFNDVYGKTVTMRFFKQSNFKATDTVITREQQDFMEFSAACDGYVTLTPQGEFHVVSPVAVSEDKMAMDVVLLSTVTHKEGLLDLLFETAKVKDDRLRVELPERTAALDLFESGTVTKVRVRRGIPPRQGADATLRVHIDPEKKPPEDDLYVDMKAFSSLYEISEGTLIAERTPAVPGIPGLSVLAEPIVPESVTDILFRAGTNVRERVEEGSILYVAEQTGLLRLSDKGADISESLHVSGDVGPRTGNIDFTKSIVIQGDVSAGYQVVCGKDLAVKGSVNEGAVVLCKGNLSVSDGVFGKTTDLEVNGDAEIGFIQESRLRVNHNLVVHGTIYNSQVFSGGQLVVEGRNIDPEKRGCVIGGHIAAMTSIDLHSLGSFAMPTRLTCGVDKASAGIVKRAQTSITTLNRRIARLRREMPVDLTRPDAARVLNRLPPEVKNKVKDQLLELKKLIGSLEQFQKRLPSLREKAWHPDPRECFIVVRKRLFPDVTVQIGRARKAIRSGDTHVLFKLSENEILATSAGL